MHFYPTIPRRYISSIIDGVFLLIVWFIFLTIYLQNRDLVQRAFTFSLLGLFFYEPILISRWCTIGQKLTGIRIRSFSDITKNISFAQGVIRSATKFIFGIISFFTISFNKNRRAIHDYAANSIVILKDQEIIARDYLGQGPLTEQPKTDTFDDTVNYKAGAAVVFIYICIVFLFKARHFIQVEESVVKKEYLKNPYMLGDPAKHKITEEFNKNMKEFAEKPGYLASQVMLPLGIKIRNLNGWHSLQVPSKYKWPKYRLQKIIDQFAMTHSNPIDLWTIQISELSTESDFMSFDNGKKDQILFNALIGPQRSEDVSEKIGYNYHSQRKIRLDTHDWRTFMVSLPFKTNPAKAEYNMTLYYTAYKDYVLVFYCWNPAPADDRIKNEENEIEKIISSVSFP